MGVRDELSKETIAKARQWKATWDKRTGKTFYQHRFSGEAQWEKPPGFDEAQMELKERKSRKADKAGSRFCENIIVNNSSSSTADREAEEVSRDAANPTSLFWYLQQKYWAAASKRVRNKPREAKIWISKGLDGNCTCLSGSWKVLPLHASIILGAPSGLIIQILDSFPGAARKKDLNGSLPTHIAACSLSAHTHGEQVFEALLRAYPAARNIEDRNGHTPVNILHRSQVWKDPETRQKWQRKLNMLASEIGKEGIETKLGNGGKPRKALCTSNYSAIPIPDFVEFTTCPDDISSIGNRSSSRILSPKKSPKRQRKMKMTAPESEKEIIETQLKREGFLNKTKQKWQKKLKILASENKQEGIEAQLEILPDNGGNPCKASRTVGDLMDRVPHDLEYTACIGAHSSSLGNPSSLWSSGSGSSGPKEARALKAISIAMKASSVPDEGGSNVAAKAEDSRGAANEVSNDVDASLSMLGSFDVFSQELPSNNSSDFFDSASMKAITFINSKLARLRKSKPDDLQDDTIARSMSCNDCPPRSNDTDEILDCLMPSKSFPPHSNLDEDLRVKNRNCSAISSVKELARAGDNNNRAKADNLRQALGRSPIALKYHSSFAKSRIEDTPGDSILHSKSHTEFSPHMKDMAGLYDCIMTPKSFPPISTHAIPSIDGNLSIKTEESNISSSLKEPALETTCNETNPETKEWGRTPETASFTLKTHPDITTSIVNSRSFPSHSTLTVPRIDEDLSVDTEELSVSSSSIEPTSQSDNGATPAAENRRQALDMSSFALKSRPSLAKSILEDPPYKNIVHSKSHSDCSPSMNTADKLYDSMMTSQTFPLCSTKTLPTIDEDLSFARSREPLGESAIDNETNGEASKWREGLDGMTKKSYYSHRGTNSVLWGRPRGFNDNQKWGDYDKEPEKDVGTKGSESCESYDAIMMARSHSSGNSSGSSTESFRQTSLGAHTSLPQDDVESPTILFLFLYKRDWANSLVRLKKHPEEAGVWVWRRARGSCLWRLLPLHASIVLGAPSRVILVLLTANPDAARQRDMNGSLPVHLAASSIDSHEDGEAIFKHILRIFPESIDIGDGLGNTARELAQMHLRHIDASEYFSIEPDDDLMLGQSKTDVLVGLTATVSDVTKSEGDSKSGGFTLESGFTAFDPDEEIDPSSIGDDDLERLKSGFIHVTLDDVYCD